MEGKIPPEPLESTPGRSVCSWGEGAFLTWCSPSTPQGITEGTAWMPVTSTPARTSPCVAASRAPPWATCASVQGTFSGSTASTGETQGAQQGLGLRCLALCCSPIPAVRHLGATLGAARCNSEDVSVPRMDQQCPKGWWGNPSCGPCNCDVNKGFDPDCNKTNGQCHCKVRGSCARGDVACLCLVLFAAWQLPGCCFVSSPPCGPPGPAR